MTHSGPCSVVRLDVRDGRVDHDLDGTVPEDEHRVCRACCLAIAGRGRRVGVDDESDGVVTVARRTRTRRRAR